MPEATAQNRKLISRLSRAMTDFSEADVRAALADLVADDAMIHHCHPFGDMPGAAFYDRAFAPLFAAWPDLERRDYIVMAGADDHGGEWVGCAGFYTGTFLAPFLDIPPTGHIAHMRFHEFYRCVGGQVVEVQAIWDIAEVMMQAHAWPLAPSLGREMLVPAPASADGFRTEPGDAAQGAASKSLIVDMLAHMIRHPAQGGPEVMEMPRFWHPRAMWYGPAGIGSARGIQGFRNWHQIPFLNGMPDRGKSAKGATHHFFGDGPYCAVTGWPNMVQTLSAPGWLGIAPPGMSIEMRSLDFWRIENDLIRENWVLIDLLDVYRQIGVDVFARLQEFNKARNIGPIPQSGGPA